MESIEQTKSSQMNENTSSIIYIWLGVSLHLILLHYFPSINGIKATLLTLVFISIWLPLVVFSSSDLKKRIDQAVHTRPWLIYLLMVLYLVFLFCMPD